MSIEDFPENTFIRQTEVIGVNTESVKRVETWPSIEKIKRMIVNKSIDSMTISQV